MIAVETRASKSDKPEIFFLSIFIYSIQVPPVKFPPSSTSDINLLIEKFPNLPKLTALKYGINSNGYSFVVAFPGGTRQTPPKADALLQT